MSLLFGPSRDPKTEVQGGPEAEAAYLEKPGAQICLGHAYLFKPAG